ncbi:MAG: hypothetical protein JNK76_10155 [Planctomycetales bacterium]|nr:hypothetical protein [Planctomycetales bacterium]MBN8625400.1 hypothetical protein [Planctomycetota bacterium]
MKRLMLAVCLLSAMLSPIVADAAVTTAAIRETVEFVTKKFSKEAAEEGTELLAKKIEVFATKYGDDGLKAVRELGPQAMTAAGKAGAQAPAAVRAMARYGDDGVEWIAKRPQNLELAAKYGDDAVEAIVKHKEVAEPLVKELGEQGAKALKAVSPQQGRQLAMLAADQSTAAMARNPQLLGVVSKYGDNGMNFIWRNKGALAVGTTLAAFLANPQPFIDGTAQLAQAAGENFVKPMTEGIVGAIDWTVIAILVVMMVGLGGVWRSYLKHRAALRKAAP